MKLKRARTATALAAVAILAGTQAAFAINTVSVDGTTTPAGPTSMTGTTYAPSNPNYLGWIGFMSNYGVGTTCRQGDFEGYSLRGASSTIGNKVAAITKIDLTNCLATGFLYPVVGIKKLGSPEWPIHLDETPTKAQRFVKVEIRNIYGDFHSTTPPGTWPCVFQFAGTVKAQIDTLLDQLIINTPSLTASHQEPLVLDALDSNGTKSGATVSSCAGEYQDGDLMSMNGKFQLDRDIEMG